MNSRTSNGRANTRLARHPDRNRPPRIIFNDDSDSLRHVVPPHSASKINLAADYLKGTQVDMLCWCVADQLAYSYPSKRVESAFDLIRQAEGKANLAGWRLENNLMYSLYKQGTDYLPLFIDRVHRLGKSLVASFRMNDCHLKSYTQSCLTPEFWKQNQHLRLWGATDAKTYYNAALNYAFPEVRRYYATMIREVAENYAVDGVELDFSRTPYLFQPDEAVAKRHVLTKFVADIRKMLDTIGAKKKTRLQLVIRTLFSKEDLDRFGMDLESWIDRRLCDVLVLTNLDTDYNQNLQPWLGLCRKQKIPLYPCIETNPALYDGDFTSPLPNNPLAPAHNYNYHERNVAKKLEQMRGAAQNYLAQGASGVYLFNFRCLPDPYDKLTGDDRKQLGTILTEIGEGETVEKLPKQYLFWTDFLQVETARPPQYHQTLTFAVRDPLVREKGTRLTLQFREVARKNPHYDGPPKAAGKEPESWVPRGRLLYILNGRQIPERSIRREAQPEGRIPCGFVLDQHRLVTMSLPGSYLNAGENKLAIFMPGFPHESEPYVYIYELAVAVNSPQKNTENTSKWRRKNEQYHEMV